MSSERVKKLRFIRIYDGDLIPRYLVENNKERTFDVNHFYNVLKLAANSLTTFLYVLVDEENIIVGYLWIELDLLGKKFIVNTLSIDKSYWGEHVFDIVDDFVKELMHKNNIKRVWWITSRPAYYCKKGYFESKDTIMEYKVTEV